MRKTILSTIAALVVSTVVSVAVPAQPIQAKAQTEQVVLAAKADVKLNKTEAWIYTKKNVNAKKGFNETVTLKLNGASGTVKWTVADKSIAKVSSKGKVTAVKEGTTTVTATCGGKKYTCKIHVRGKQYPEGFYAVTENWDELSEMYGFTSETSAYSVCKAIANRFGWDEEFYMRQGTKKLAAQKYAEMDSYYDRELYVSKYAAYATIVLGYDITKDEQLVKWLSLSGLNAKKLAKKIPEAVHYK